MILSKSTLHRLHISNGWRILIYLAADLFRVPLIIQIYGRIPRALVKNFQLRILLPTKYDLRDYNRVPEIRNQNPWNTCWAFASLASLESTFLNLYPDYQDIDLSEMFIAYFAYGDKRPGKSYYLYNSEADILNQGGNYNQAAALLARLGTVNESTLRYSRTTIKKLPEEYEKAAIRLKDVYELGTLSGNEIIQAVKNLIINNGAVYAAYYSDNDGYYDIYSSYFNNQTDDEGNPLTPNHAISIIGWDDSYPRYSFSPVKPAKSGAWLVRNSWGSGWLYNRGYFWMSYEQFITDAVIFIADKSSKYIKHYGHDDLGRISGIYINWSASIFKNESDDEILQYTGFNAIDNNTDYEIYIYDLGTEKPSSPIEGVLLASRDNYTPYKGYHTEDFSQENIRLKGGHYFSVVMKTNTGIGTEATYENNVIVNPEESYYSSDGLTWSDLYNIPLDDDNDYKHNACIKAFTVPDTALSGIEINEINFPDQYFRQKLSMRAYDKDSDGILTPEEISDIKDFILPIQTKSLKGLELLTSLNYLRCGYGTKTELTELSISNHPSLTYLNCRGNNNLTNLSLNNNPALKYINCYNNRELTELNISDNPALISFDCKGNYSLVSFDLSKNPALSYINYENSGLTKLNISNYPALNYFRCCNNAVLTS